jgi:hypothetical protein
MTSDLDIYRTASVLIREHGEEADLVAAMRADSFLEAGAMDGSAVWKRVLKAIKEIERQERLEGEANQFVRGWRAAIRAAKAILLVAPQCPSWVKNGPPAPCPFTSAVGG